MQIGLSTGLSRASRRVVSSDPYFDSVTLLLHMNGANGSTTFTDSSPLANVVTAFGNAQISTAQSKFGTSSGKFDGAGDYLRIPTSTGFAFGTGDFTIEFWIYRTNSGQQHIYEGRRNSVTNRLLIYLNALTKLALNSNGANVIEASTELTGLQWVHCALCRGSGISRLFVDGTQVGSSYADTFNYAAPSDFLYIGANDVANGSFLNAHLQDFRVTKGIARYTANFTPPTEQFPDS